MNPENQAVSRRSFFKGAAAGAAALHGPTIVQRAIAAENRFPATDRPAPTFDFARDSNALQADRIVDSACQFCNSLCRLKVHLKAGRIIDITGETEDPVQAGGLCVKGPMVAQLVYNRLRLRHPLKRFAGEKALPIPGSSRFRGMRRWESSPGG